MKKLFFVFTFVSLLFCQSGVIHAEQKDVDNLMDMSLEDLLKIKVTVASKSSESALDASSSVSVLNKAQINALGVKTFTQLLSYVPGFIGTIDTPDNHDDGPVAARGQRVFASKTVLVLVDGVRMNDALHGSIRMGSLIAIERIKQVEFIRGPGSALYGSNAYTGVINIITDDNYNAVTMYGGDRGQKSISINSAKNISEDLKYSASVKYMTDDGYQSSILAYNGNTNNTVADETNPIKIVDAAFKLKFKDNLSAGVSITERDSSNFFLSNIAYNFKATDKFDISAKLAFTRDHNVVEPTYTGSYFSMGSFSYVNADLWDNTVYTEDHLILNLDTTYNLFETNNYVTDIMVGYSFNRFRMTECYSIKNYNPTTYASLYQLSKWETDTYALIDLSEAHRHVNAAYFQLKQRLFNVLNITAGFRLDNYSDVGNTFNPRIGLVYSTPINSKIKLMYGQAFRAPTFHEKYSINGMFTAADGLGPEKIRTVELAYVQQYKNLQGTLTFFHNTAINLIETTFIGFSAVFDNAETNRWTQGLEFDFQGAFTKNIFAGIALTKFIKCTHNLQNTPDFFGSLYTTIQYSDLNFNVSGIFHGDANVNENTSVGNRNGFFVTNTKLSYEIEPGFEIFGTINNVFDYKYEIGVFGFTQVKGRNWTLGLTANI